MSCILCLTKSSSVNQCIVLDIVTYTIEVKNISNMLVENIVVKDLLPEDLKFIIGSVKIDYQSDDYSNIISGVNIGNLNCDEIKIITFQAQIIRKSSNLIKNSATAEFKYTQKNQTQCSCCHSNTSEILVKNPSITIVKESDKEMVQLDSLINFTLTIRNTGDLDLENIFLVDNLSKSVELIDGSFKIDGRVVHSVELEKGIMLDDLEQGESVIVTYTGKVVSGGCSGKIINFAKVTFSYTLLNGFTAYKESNSATISINMSISSFKQINIDEYLKIPPQKPDIEEINDIKANISITNFNVVKTSVGRSSEGQILSGYKLIVHGFLNQSIEYIAKEPTQALHSAHYSVPFSSYIVLPVDYTLGNKIEVEGIIEDIYHIVIDRRCFFKNITILLLAKIMCCY